VKTYLQNSLPLLVSSAVIITMTGCSAKIADLTTYKPVSMAQSKFMPTQFNNAKPKVVVLELSNGKNQSAIKADVGMTTSVEVEKFLNESGAIEVVDRSAAEKLKSEIQLVEMGGNNPYSGPAIASYAISGNISNAGMSSKFIEASQYVDKKGYVHRTPASCTYISTVAGTVKIYELPNMKVSLSRPFSETKRQSEDARSAYDCARADDSALIRAAAVDSAEEMRHDLKNFFAKKAYISEKRISADGKEMIFKIEFGTNDGAKAGDAIEIYTIEENINPLQNITTQEEVKIGKATISQQITQNACWILVDNKEIAEKIKLGDYVKLHYEKSLFEGMKNAGNTLNAIMAY
jgi:hypothetical protein